MDDVGTSTIQPVVEEFHPSRSEKNIQIPEVGQMHHSQRIPVPQHQFNIDNEALMLHEE